MQSQSTAIQRLSKEFKDILEKPSEYYSVYPEETDKTGFVWRAMVFGPLTSAYRGGIFEFKLVFPTDYPFNPP